MTGVTFIKNEKGTPTHVVIDWEKHGKHLQEFLEDIEDIASARETDGEEMLSLKEAIEEMAKHEKLSKDELLKIADV